MRLPALRRSVGRLLVVALCCHCYLSNVGFVAASSFQRHKKRESKEEVWNYQDLENWGLVNPVCVNGRRQSPIHISTQEAVMDQQLFKDPLKFVNYAGSYYGTLSNSGISIVWTINASIAYDLPRIAGSGLGSPGFVLDQLHFHWGPSSESNCLSSDSYCVGSEHVIDYRSAPMELHLVHYNTKYKSFSEAMSKPDGLAVLAFLFSVTENGTPDGDYGVIAGTIPQVSVPTNRVGLMISLPKMIPLVMLQSGVYYRYEGSLTAPPCYESVIWTVFADRLPITAKSLEVFRSQVFIEGAPGSSVRRFDVLDNNFRPIQRQNSRTVTTNSHYARVPADFNPSMADFSTSGTSHPSSSPSSSTIKTLICAFAIANLLQLALTSLNPLIITTATTSHYHHPRQQQLLLLPR